MSLRSTIKVNTEGIKEFFEYANRAKREIAAIEKILQSKGFKGTARELKRAATAYRREFLKAIGDIEKADLSRIKKVMDTQKEFLQERVNEGGDDAGSAQSDLNQLNVSSDVLEVLTQEATESTDALDQLNAALAETAEANATAAEGFEVTDETIQSATSNILALKERNKEIKDALENAPQKGAEGYEELKDIIEALTEEYSVNRDTILEFNRGLRQGVQETELAKGSIFELAQTVRQLTKEYSAMSEEERKSAAGVELKEKIAETRKELNGLRAEIGDNRGFVGAYERALNGLNTPLRSVQAGIKGFSSALKLLLANPIVAVIVSLVAALTALFKAFTGTKRGAELMERASAAVSAVFGVLRDIAAGLAETLVEVFTNPVDSLKSLGSLIVNNLINRFKGLIDVVFATGKALKAVATLDMEALRASADEARTAFVQLGTGMDADQQREFTQTVTETSQRLADAAADASRLTGELQRLRDEQRGLRVERAEMNTELVAARDAARDTNRPLSERIELLKQVQAAEGDLIQKEIANQERRIAAIRELQGINDSSAEDLDELANEEIKLEQLKQKSLSNSLTLRRNLLTLRREQIKNAKDEAKAEADAVKAIVKERQRLLAVMEKANESRIKSLATFLNKLKQIEIENIEDTTKQLLEKEKERYRLQETAQIENFNSIIDKQLQSLAEIQANDEISAEEKKRFEQKTNASILALTEAHNRLLQEQEKKHLRTMANIREDAARKEKEEREKEHEALEKEREEADREEAEAHDAKIKAEIEAYKKGEEEKAKNAAEANKATQAAIKSSIAATFDIVSRITQIAADAENKYFEDAIEARENTITELESQLQNATGVHRDFLEKQIEEERRAQEELKRNAEKAQREQAETQRAIAITQAVVNTALAVTQALGSSPPPASFILAGTAAALGAVEIATIATQKFARGGIVEGASHANGGVPALVDGKYDVELEGGEIVINKNSARMYRKELSDINVKGGGKKFQFGGEIAPNFQALSQTGTGDKDRMLKELENLSIFVDVTEISNLQDKKAELLGMSTF